MAESIAVQPLTPTLSPEYRGEGRGDFFQGVVRFGSADGEITAVLMFFERAEQFGKLRAAAAQRHFDAATGGDIAGAVGGMHVHHVRTERLRRFARIKAVHNQVCGIEIDTDGSRRQRFDELQQIGATFSPCFRGQHCADTLAFAADIGKSGAKRSQRRSVFVRRHATDVIDHDVGTELISELESIFRGIDAAVEFVHIGVAAARAEAEGSHPQIQIFQHFPHLPHTCTA